MSVLFSDCFCELRKPDMEKLKMEYIDIPFILCDSVVPYNMGENFNFDKYNQMITNCNDIKIELDIKKIERKIIPYLEQNEDILIVHSSKKIFPNFTLFQECISQLCDKYKNRKIKLIDTSHFGMSEGLIVYDISLMHKRGATDNEIIEKVERLKDNISQFFILDEDINNNLLNIQTENTDISNNFMKLVYSEENDGKMTCVSKFISRKKAINFVVDKFNSIKENVLDYNIYIEYRDLDDDVNYLKEKLKSSFDKDVNIIVQQFSPYLSALLGRNAISLTFHSKKGKRQ